ncbi:hypothetical protein BLA39750_02325 [Burkholderia lata]|uniref:Uncharacterized protein n=1 Tax=Burkholderia lata (strain ATCC 17760 / DSM 23089 / LMG 22485 / NCIMB 9086 / R18194 / 383) TaxID=482957 RepID=A0A6P2W228_BURL3|nr:hypothetical protein [Burkholderia lata]VWC97591.1 hypothetical protein BLA39750_02325 [Burkholderia lata]
MIQSLLQMHDTTPLPEMCIRLGEVLGMDKPVPMPVLLRAIEDPGFAADLITSRGQPGFLTALFDDRRTRAYAPSEPSAGTQSAVALAGKAAAAMLRWGKAGFSTVDAQTLERRESACLGCPNLRDPESGVQKMVLVGAVTDQVGRRLGGKVCGLCGCVVHKKIRLPTEACPDTHPVKSGLTRWDEPIPAEALQS